MAMCLTSVAKAQLYGSDVYYYVPAGVNITDGTEIYMFYFDGTDLGCLSRSRKNIIKYLEEDSEHWCDELKRQLEKRTSTSEKKYDSSVSTSSRTVYKGAWLGPMSTYGVGTNWGTYYPRIGDTYYAFSNDKESLIIWRERKNSSDVVDKKYYKRVDVKDLMPKAANRDFLYD